MSVAIRGEGVEKSRGMEPSGRSGGAIAATPPRSIQHTTSVAAVALRMSTEVRSVEVRIGVSCPG